MSVELVLRSLSNNRPVKLHRPHPLVIDGDKIGFFTAFRASWVFFPLVDHVASLRNGIAVGQGCELKTDDLLQLGPMHFRVENSSTSTSNAPSPLTADDPPLCWFNIHTGGEETEETIVEGKAIIGSSLQCNIRLPESGSTHALHALLTFADNEWYLFDLTGQKLTRNNNPPEYSFKLHNDDTVRIGESILVFHTDHVSNFDSQPSVETMVRDLQAQDSDPSPSSKNPRSKISVAYKDDPVYRSGKELCEWLQGSLRNQSTSNSGSGPGSVRRGIGSLVRGLTQRETPSEVLDRFRRELEKQPSHRDTLFSLARFFSEQGYPDLARWILKELYRINSQDLETLETLVRLCLAEGRKKDLPRDERLDHYNRAEKYAAKAVTLSPEAYGLIELQRIVSAERTMLEGGLDSTFDGESPTS
jgi:hypothetical protein